MKTKVISVFIFAALFTFMIVLISLQDRDEVVIETSKTVYMHNEGRVNYIITNNTGAEISSGQRIWLEIKKNDTWELLPSNFVDSITWCRVIYTYKEGENKEYISFSNYYSADLVGGTFRIAFRYMPAGENNSYTAYSNEFTITE